MKKKGIVFNEITWWIIALVILVIVVLGLMLMHKSGMNLIDTLKNLLRFGR